MPSREAQIAAFARSVARRDKSSTYAPLDAQLSLHMGRIADVDLATGTVRWSFNGGGEVGGIPFVHAYSPTNLPQPGDDAWGVYNGSGSFMALGRHSVPTGVVIL